MIEPYRLLDIPPIDSPDNDEHGWKYRAVHELARADRLAAHGNDDQTPSVHKLIAQRAGRLHFDQQWVLAVRETGDAPRALGWAWVGLPIHEDLDKAQLQICVHPRMRGRGVGSALLEWGETLISHTARTLVFSASVYGTKEDREPYLEISDGKVPAAAPGVSFLTNRGYGLAHAERCSVLAMPMDPGLYQKLMAATVPYTAEYRLHTWFCEIPEEWKDSFARLKEEFSCDAPQGTVTFEQEHWNRGRVDQMVREILNQGNVFLMTAAEHAATGELVGFTELRWPRGGGVEAASQWFTIVSREHRGHRLGMWIKLVNASELVALNPGIRRIHTDNAQENVHMLGINIAMGFTPNGGIALLTKPLV